MRKLCLPGTLILALLISNAAVAQDFSNKGKDFWVGYGYHQTMSIGGGGPQNMVLYFATEAATNVTVSIPGTGYLQSYSIPANTIFTSNPIPKTGVEDARLTREGISNKGIHITSDKPIVAYAHIYNASVSGATLLFPVNTLGKEYYSINYEQASNTANSNCWFYAVAVDPGVTTVQITPSQATAGHAAGVPFTVTLAQGEVINIMGKVNGTQSGSVWRGVDLTGSKIESISTGTGGCKRLAVFSGSGRLSISCDGSGQSSDNYMVQAFPKNAWGKNYLTVPTQNFENNFYRIAVSDPSTVVRFNGAILTGLINNFYYEVGPIKSLNKIQANKPVMVAQYITSAEFCGNNAIGGDGDPEMIYLSSIEQTINRVILNSASNYQINDNYHFINVIIPNSGTAISSFRIDGARPAGTFFTHPQNPAYSYIKINAGPGQHILESDSGFNAIAYGYGDHESYGYNAGTNVKDLYQFISVANQYASVDFPAACKGAPFFLKMTFPYEPTQIIWQFNGLFPDVTINSPFYDQTTIVNGRTLYKYKLPASYTVPGAGIYPIKILAQNPTADGCSGLQELDFDLEVFDPPVADFNFSTTGCVSDPVSFEGVAATSGRPVKHWHWNFGDGDATSNSDSVNHTYSAPGSYDVKYTVITDVGCKADTATRTVILNNPPVALFSPIAPYCADKMITFADMSSVSSGSITKWHWNFGDGTPTVTTSLTNTNQTHIYAAAGSYTVTLQVETDSGCLSTVFSKDVVVNPVPSAGFISPEICVNDVLAPFTDTSRISSGAITGWEWNFGNANATASNLNTSNLQNPTHNYTVPGNYTAQLIATSNTGCKDTITQMVSVNGGVITPKFTVENTTALCSNKEIIIKDASTIDVGTLLRVEIFWDAADITIKTIDDNPAPGKIYTHTYPEFGSPAAKTYTIKYDVYSGIACMNSYTENITLLATPQLAFVPVPPVCSNATALRLSAQLMNALPGNGTFNGKGLSSDGHFDPKDAGSGSHVLTYIYTATNGCINSVDQTVMVNPTPIADAGADKTVLEGEGGVTLTPKIINNIPVSYTWNPATWLKNPFIANTEASPPADYTYTLIVTSDKGCVANDEVFVKLLKTPIIPNIFSPNGDGIHDKWIIDYLGSYPGCVIQIYNRYGQMIQRFVNYTTPWDGKINGRDVPVGTYYYVIDPKNGRKPITGFVDIIR